MHFPGSAWRQWRQPSVRAPAQSRIHGELGCPRGAEPDVLWGGVLSWV